MVLTKASIDAGAMPLLDYVGLARCDSCSDDAKTAVYDAVARREARHAGATQS